jgi:trehalose 6-phosphate synthase/phosphatase
MQLVIVSNRLPVSVKKEHGKLSYHSSVGGLATGLGSYAKNKKNIWVGWPGVASDDLTEKDRREITEALQKENCYPVFLTKRQLELFYNGYSNSVLWPLFHDRKVSEETFRSLATYWKAYEKVNALFAEVVLALSQPGHNIWIHDYQLLLLPQILRAERPKDKLGFFLHIPFPAVKKFSTLPQWQLLIQGMLGADVIGFHTQSYTNNFLDATNYTGVGIVERNKIVLSNRVVRVTDFPIGIDYEKYVAARKSPAVMKELAKLRVKYRGKRVILTVDRLDPAKGLVERAVAYNTLLAENPELRRKVTMVMLVVPSRTAIKEYADLKKELERQIRQTNKTYGTALWKPIQYHYTALPFARVTALYRRADVAFIAPLRDGMNLVAKEYIASKPSQRGVLVLSKTAGAAEQLKDAIMVDPGRPQTLVKGLKKALSMPPKEFKRRTKKMQDQIAETNIQRWAGSFVKTLSLDNAARPHRAHALTAKRRALFITSYHLAKNRLLLLDYDGTLVPFHDDPDHAAPSPELKKLLRKLAKDPRTTVVIISGRSKEDLGKWFKNTSMILVAEHGAFMKKPGHNWQTTINDEDLTWKSLVLPALEKHAKRAPGSFVEQKDVSLVWHFRKSSPYHAHKELVVLQRALKSISKRLKLELRQGNKILEIRPDTLHKGTVIGELLKDNPDFVLALGDDYTDEDIFTTLPETAYTVKVGHGRTAARYRISGIRTVQEFLGKFITPPGI